MGAVGNWISDAWKSTVGQAWEVIGVNQLWEASGAQDLWENAYDSARDWINGDDKSESGTLTSSGAGGISLGNTKEESSTEDTSASTEDAENVGGEADATEASNVVRSSANKGSLVSSGIPTFGFTEESGSSAGKVKKLGA